MKSLLLILVSLMSITANAGAVSALTSIVSVGTHYGTNANGDCSITVKQVNFPANAVMVTAADSSNEVSKLVEDGTEYQTCRRGNCGGGKNFLQVDRVNIGSGNSSYVENILRTALSETNEGKLYVVVAELTVINRSSNEIAVECEI